MALSKLRTEYRARPLRERDCPRAPHALVRRWLDDAIAAGIAEPNAMALATADRRGRPAVRLVLLKGFGADGFTFFTHRASRKGRELSANPRAALALYWHPLHRQLRVEGRVTALDPAAADGYFATRPRGARLAAWASPQSRPIASRAALERRVKAARDRLAGREIPRPAGWVGYVLAPDAVEFWQGRPDRLHDRLLYVRAGTRWRRRRLAP